MNFDEVDVVVRREYRDANGARVDLLIGRPVPDPRQRDVWVCPFVIVRNGSPGRVFEIFGVDALQALILALGVIKAGLESEERTSGPFTWLEEPGLGLDFEILGPGRLKGESRN